MVLNTVKSLLLGSTLRVVGSIALVLVVALGGAFAAGIIGVPSVDSVDNEFGEVNDSHTEIRTNMTITNPNPVGAGAADVSADYVVSMNDVEMARGGGGEIGLESGTSTESFVTYMNNERIPAWWVTHVRNGERTDVAIDATVTSGALDRSTEITDRRTVETDLLSEFNSTETRPVNASRPLVDDPVLYINETRANWGSVDDQHTELALRFDAYNPKSYDIPVSQIGYTISMNGVVVGEGESDREYVLRSGEVTGLETTTRIENENLDEWWVTHVENDEVSELRIDFEAQLELASGVTVTVPLDALTYEETVETDIWGNKNASADGEAGNASDGTNETDGSGDGTNDSTDETNESDGSDDGSEDGSADEDGTSDDDSSGETTETPTETDSSGDDDGVGLPELPLVEQVAG